VLQDGTQTAPHTRDAPHQAPPHTHPYTCHRATALTLDGVIGGSERVRTDPVLGALQPLYRKQSPTIHAHTAPFEARAREPLNRLLFLSGVLSDCRLALFSAGEKWPLFKKSSAAAPSTKARARNARLACVCVSFLLIYDVYINFRFLQEL
jgi:hypothetical protein